MSCRPDFAILIYPVITMGEKAHAGTKANLLGRDPKPEMVDLFSNEKQVTDKTPPMFLAHAKDDTVVAPDNSRMLYEALKAHKVPAEYLELPSGGHGLNGYKGPMWDAWQTKSLEWLERLERPALPVLERTFGRRDLPLGPGDGPGGTPPAAGDEAFLAGPLAAFLLAEGSRGRPPIHQGQGRRHYPGTDDYHTKAKRKRGSLAYASPWCGSGYYAGRGGPFAGGNGTRVLALGGG